jgi:REP element-mobilizing transposase RayT
MTRARREQVCLESTPFYHCICRCVRRAFLCGDDYHSGQNFDHRKQWVVERVKQLSSIFSVDICAYAIMSNHYHLVLRIDQKRALAWSKEEVIERWCQLFSGHLIVDRWLTGTLMSKAELKVMDELIETWRERLYDLGWYMRCLNETIARQANEEDNCKGRFWEGRYKSQALLDEAALLSCMAYVDLNPIRAGISQTPETSEFTSIQERIAAYSEGERQDKVLANFKRGKQQKEDELPMRQDDYFQLVDWTGRAIRDDKQGHIPNHLADILSRLRIDPNNWLKGIDKIETHFHQAVGCKAQLQAFSHTLGRKWLKGVGSSRVMFH